MQTYRIGILPSTFLNIKAGIKSFNGYNGFLDNYKDINFEYAYDTNSKLAGTYIRPNYDSAILARK
jgi:hypothetical protein